MVHEAGPSHRERLRVEKVHTAAGKRREKKKKGNREKPRWCGVAAAGGSL